MHRVIALLIASLGLLRDAVLAAEKPNVLFIAVDDLKPVLGCYGDKLVKSPNIDRLAARGVVFDRAYCNQAVCAPSRNSLLTGRRPTTLGIYDLGTNFRKAAPDAVTLPQHFMAHGYRAEGLGKIFHTGHGNVDDAASWSVPLFKEKTVTYVLPENLKAMSREEALFANQAVTKDMVRGVPTEAADVPDEGYPDGRIAAEAVRRLHAAAEKPGTPFFIAVGFLKPHLPFCAPKKYWDLYDRAAFPLAERRTPPEGAPAFAPTNWGELRNYSDIPEVGPVNDERARELIHGYYAATSSVDAQLGRVLDALEKRRARGENHRRPVGRSRLAPRRPRHVEQAHQLRAGRAHPAHRRRPRHRQRPRRRARRDGRYFPHARRPRRAARARRRRGPQLRRHAARPRRADRGIRHALLPPRRAPGPRAAHPRSTA